MARSEKRLGFCSCYKVEQFIPSPPYSPRVFNWELIYSLLPLLVSTEMSSLCLRLQKSPAQLFRIFPWGPWLQPHVAGGFSTSLKGKAGNWFETPQVSSKYFASFSAPSTDWKPELWASCLCPEPTVSPRVKKVTEGESRWLGLFLPEIQSLPF